MPAHITEVEAFKRRITLDFDGVINSYQTQTDNGDPTQFPDPPVAGAKEAIDNLRRQGFRVAVLSARTSDDPGAVAAIQAYLTKHGIVVDEVTDKKLPSDLYVDDRGFRFEGDWNAVLAFVAAGTQPWHKR